MNKQNMGMAKDLDGLIITAPAVEIKEEKIKALKDVIERGKNALAHMEIQWHLKKKGLIHIKESITQLSANISSQRKMVTELEKMLEEEDNQEPKIEPVD